MGVKQWVRAMLVLAALLGVVGAVTVMGYLITRGVRNTVSEVGRAARSLAVGDVSAKVRVSGNDEIGEMAKSFNGMIENIRSLANSAEAIGKGDYGTPVNVRGPQDALGLALARMKENLKAARLRDDEQTRALQSEKEKLEQANERISVLIKEMHHRVKNNLQVINSIMKLQGARVDDDPRLQEILHHSRDRIRSMALIHESLYQNKQFSLIDLGNYIDGLARNLVMSYSLSGRISLELDLGGEPVPLVLDQASPCGLILNELISNALKHAYPGNDAGTVRVGLRMVGDQVRISVSDDGVGLPKGFDDERDGNLGLELVRMLVGQLDGHIERSGPPGATYLLTFERIK